MRKQTLVISVIVMLCVTGVLASSANVYLANTTGTFYRIRTSDYSLGSIPGFGNVRGIGALPDGQVAFGNTAGIIYVTNGDPTSWIQSAAVGGWGSISTLTATAAGNIAFGRTDGAICMLNSSLGGFSYGLGYGNISAITTLAGGKFAFGNTSGTAWTANGTLPIGGFAGAGGWTNVASMAGLSNGNVALGNTAGGVYINDSSMTYITGAGGWGGSVTAMAGLTNGNLAFGVGSTGTIFVTNSTLGGSISATGFGAITAMAALPDGNFVVGNSAGNVYFVNSTNLSLVHTTLTGFGSISTMAAVALPDPGPQGPTQFTLNGLQITLDPNNGSITKLLYPDTGTILQASSTTAGLVTTSSPTYITAQFGSQYSLATIAQQDANTYTITWSNLSSNRNGVSTGGNIQAAVTIKAAPDGRSVILSCHINNNSTVSLSQVLFPDFAGLRPFDSPENMELRLAMGVINPFGGPVHDAGRAPFYPMVLWNQYQQAGMYHMNTLRWMDFGSLKGGLSVFQKQWLTEPRPAILTHRDETDPNSLRTAWQHTPSIAAGQSWDSGEFWLTPHRGGWAKGIEVFRNYVSTVNPSRTVPTKIKEGLGFQTIWMIQSTEIDPARAAFRYTDLPTVAQDAKNCGIDNIVAWGWCKYGTLYPSIQLRSELGTMANLTSGITQAKNLGVTIAPFIDLNYLGGDLASRYGLTAGSAASWVYSPDLIPAWFPLNTPGNGIYVPSNNAAWQTDVQSQLLSLASSGITSFCWDVFQDTGDMNFVNFIKGVRTQISASDPQASFGGEPTDITTSSLERASQVLDYTWNWQNFTEAGPVLNVLKYPRINCNVENSPRVVKMAFADGLYINAMPKMPNQPNGTKLLSQEPALYAALQSTAPLRRQFLTYFTDGTFIGESVLAKPVCTFVRTKTASQTGGATFKAGKSEYPLICVRGHQLNNKLLIIVLNNDSIPRQVTLESELGMWLPATGSYTVKHYNNNGTLIGTNSWIPGGLNWTVATEQLDPLQMTFFEIAVGS
jgi:hypothetical protein